MPLRTILITATRSGTASTVIIRRGASGTGTGGGTSDHGALTGLTDSDDHPQYHNDARGDARYPLGSGTSTGTNTGDQDLSGKANLSGATFTGAITTTGATITGFATADQFNTSEGGLYSTSAIAFLAGLGPYNVNFSAGNPTATRNMALPDANGTLAVTSRDDGKIVATEIAGILPITSGGTGGATDSAARTALKVPGSIAGVGGSIAITNIVSISLTNYNALVTKDAATLYVIV